MVSHTLLKGYFNDLADIFSDYMGSFDNKKLPFQKEDHEWLNYFYNTAVTRHVHLEYYKTSKMCVLHSNIFPDPHIDLPILGFDVIALGDKITGIFFDLTPTSLSLFDINSLKNLKSKIKSPTRNLPEWANFFSDDFICITPDTEELDYIFNQIYIIIKNYLYYVTYHTKIYEKNISIQNNYCIGQKKNDKTYKSLASEIGDDNAKLFLNNYLFPEINKTN
jgi:hypothetical protein